MSKKVEEVEWHFWPEDGVIMSCSPLSGHEARAIHEELSDKGITCVELTRQRLIIADFEVVRFQKAYPDVPVRNLPPATPVAAERSRLASLAATQEPLAKLFNTIRDLPITERLGALNHIKREVEKWEAAAAKPSGKIKTQECG